MKRWTTLMMAAGAAVAIACGSDVSSPVGAGPSASRGGSDDPVTGVTITPAVVTLPIGYYAGFATLAHDAAGNRVPKRATWTSSNPSVAALVGDTGVVMGKALGTAVITATVDGISATAAVTVVAAPPVVPPTGSVGVERFTVKVVAMGIIPGTDTSKAERVPGSTIHLTRTGGVRGDTLQSPVDAGSAVADANGEATFSNLVGGSYVVRITPPANSVYAETLSGFAPPTAADITIHVTMPRK